MRKKILRAMLGFVVVAGCKKDLHSAKSLKSEGGVVGESTELVHSEVEQVDRNSGSDSEDLNADSELGGVDSDLALLVEANYTTHKFRVQIINNSEVFQPGDSYKLKFGVVREKWDSAWTSCQALGHEAKMEIPEFGKAGAIFSTKLSAKEFLDFDVKSWHSKKAMEDLSNYMKDGERMARVCLMRGQEVIAQNTVVTTHETSKGKRLAVAPPPNYSITAHGKDCATALGVEVPQFNCIDGTVIPINLNGSPAGVTVPASCDEPALLDVSNHECSKYSYMHNFLAANVRTTVICRRYVTPSGATDKMFHDVAILQTKNSGNNVKTCFFQMLAPGTGRKDTSPVYPPWKACYGDGTCAADKAKAEAFWLPASAASGGSTLNIKCYNCHDSNKRINSPYGENAGVLDEGKDGEYDFIGQAFRDSWKRGRYRIEIDKKEYDKKYPPSGTLPASSEDSDTCTQCHYLGKGSTCDDFGKQAIGDKRAQELSNYMWNDADWTKKAWMPPGHGKVGKTAYSDAYGRAKGAFYKCCSLAPSGLVPLNKSSVWVCPSPTPSPVAVAVDIF